MSGWLQDLINQQAYDPAMRISFVVAVDESGAIGQAGGLPWRMRSDMRRFKRLTTGHHILMGRKTWESIGRALPGRVNVVVSGQETYTAPDCVVVASPQEGVSLARLAGETELFVIGGARLFAALLPQAERLYLSRIHARAARADTFFPLDFLAPPGWERLSQEVIPPQQGDDYGHTFEVWRRTRGEFPVTTQPSF